MKYIIFIAIALLITLPWFARSGYLLLLDWPGVPIPSTQLNTTGGIAGLPTQFAWVGLSQITGSALAQKILVFLMLSAAGITTYILARYITSNTLASVTAGIFMITNAFVFNRLQMGHINLLFAYAMSPYALYLVLRFIQYPSVKNALHASIASSIITLLSIHHIILLPIMITLFAWNYWNKANYRLKYMLPLFGPYLATSIIILLIAYTNPASSIFALSPHDTTLFAPRPQCSNSVVLDTILLVAQWRNPQAPPLPCANKTFFYAVNSILIGIMLVGAFKNKKLALGTLILIVLADIPFIPAMRDSAKYLADLALLEAILLAYGVAYMHNKMRSTLLPMLACCVALLAGMPIYWGLSNTIIPKQYPASWYAFNQSLATLPERPRILFLPWHLYMPFDFTNGITIASPAQDFFTNATIIKSNNPEMGQLDTTPLETLLEKYRPQYIALASGSPDELSLRTALSATPFLHQISDTPGLTVWRIEEFPPSPFANYSHQ